MFASCLLLLASTLADVHPHYVMIFGHQDRTDDRQPDPKASHSWLTWAEANDDHDINEAFTVSWTGVHGVKFLYGPMPARNLNLDQTLERATKRGLCMKMWGPYRIDECHYQKAKARHGQLEQGATTGRLKYNLWDRLTRTDPVNPSFNCLHAFLDAKGEMIDSNNRYGFRASEYFAQVFIEQGYAQPKQPEDVWVWNALKPEPYQVSIAERP